VEKRNPNYGRSGCVNNGRSNENSHGKSKQDEKTTIILPNRLFYPTANVRRMWSCYLLYEGVVVKTGIYEIGKVTLEPPDYEDDIEIYVDRDGGYSVFVDMYDLQKWLNKVIEEKEKES